MPTPLVVRDITHTRPTGPVRVPEIMIMFTVSGRGKVVSADGRIVPAKAGTIVTVPRAATFCGIPQGHTRTLTMHAHPDYVSDQLRWLPALHPLVHLLQRSVYGDQALRHLQLHTKAMTRISRRLVEMAQMRGYANAEFTVLSLAAEVFDLVGRAAGGNREQTGISPAAYLSRLRTERMAELLTTESIGVAEAAREVGWSSHALATRRFRQRYGVSPSEYVLISRLR